MARRRAGVFVVGERRPLARKMQTTKCERQNADDDAIMRFEITIENIPAQGLSSE
jgi:hypothetical protein